MKRFTLKSLKLIAAISLATVAACGGYEGDDLTSSEDELVISGSLDDKLQTNVFAPSGDGSGTQIKYGCGGLPDGCTTLKLRCGNLGGTVKTDDYGNTKCDCGSNEKCSTGLSAYNYPQVN